ncbi:unconventional myosin-Vb [Periophthalmus magnuspinnatus]|uniref:unconventional myosin-Vb n=1 Tax=Periophthalmus magnuspinnatus TaxID=409849 RepID=UPI002436B9B0|nr:unconventional myosin-Vb [Periophthalmus magnuspinnatus]
MGPLELYCKGATVWVPDEDAVWVSAQLLRDYNPEERLLCLQLGNGLELHYTVASLSDLPPLGNPDILEGENDLTALSFLHEPAVLHNLRVRFLDFNSIYTYCGIVLVAINPYDQLPLYGEEVIDAYSGQDMADMEPHIFSVAEEAYRTMTREEKNQSIIISGESGSGKTVSAKFTMRYFAVVGGAAQQTSVEERVLASNPIMEAIGNAKTIRNDNSSRFGKYIEIGFGRKGDIIGANMRTYLLEKSRVVFQASSERNYHIFYQLCSARNYPELRELKLLAPEDFCYTRQGGDMHIPGTNDLAELKRTSDALTILGVQADQQMELFRILAAILHLGNVNIQASGRNSDRSYIDADDSSLAIFSKLLGVEGPQMAHWLCNRRLTVGGETLVKPVSGQQAVEAQNALSKHIYGQMFTWTVHRLNSALRSQRGQPKSFIGVLDIYGSATAVHVEKMFSLFFGIHLLMLFLLCCSFETFTKNSFEQFCINYANEKLQQQFNRHVFHLEQEEYIREELDWRRIEFSDNQLCINLIEGQLGLLDLLDEECRMPKGSDESWVRKLYDRHLSSTPHPHFQKPRMSNSAFIVLHFADNVQYECQGFLDKNRDTVFEELVNILKASQSELVAELFQQQSTSPSVAQESIHSGRRAHKLTVGFQFRQSLQLLMDTLNNTTPHYVRCIKPNDFKEPFTFDPKRTVQQLRACGVLETIRISAAGYPSRWTYEEFYTRYRVLLRGAHGQEQAQVSCQKALPKLIPDPEQYRFGKTKVFFRAGQVALLERLRAERLRVATVIIQSWVRRWLAQTCFHRTLWAIMTIQRYIRGALARRLTMTMRYTKAVLIIQKTYRMLVVRQLFQMIRQATITIQAFTRGTLARRQYRQLLAERAAVLVQSKVRGWLARRAYRRVRAAVVFMQCCVRRRAARRELLALKKEAKSVERYRELNKGMEVKLMQLQLRLDKEVKQATLLGETLNAERDARKEELETLRATLQKLQSQKPEPQPSPEIIKEVEEQRQANEKAVQEIERLTQELELLKNEREHFMKEKENLSAHLLTQQQAGEGNIHEAVLKATTAIKSDLDEERRKYQGLLRDFSRLEQRYDNLREMSLLTERTKGHRRTDSTQSLSFEPLSPSFTPLSSLSTTPLSASPFPSGLPSPEPVRRISVTSPTFERRSPWSSESNPMDLLMESLAVAKDPTVKMKSDDLAHAYDAVRVANKFLENQLHSQHIQWQNEMEALRSQLRKVSSSSGTIPQDFQDLLEAKEQECVRLRRELRDLKNTSTLRRLLTQVLSVSSTAQESSCVTESPKSAPVAGLLECRKKDEGKLLKNLVTELHGDLALTLPPGLSASVLFLCLRQIDQTGDQPRTRSFCTAIVSAIKAALKKHSNDLDMTALWLKNGCLLHDLLAQHSSKQTCESDEVVSFVVDLSDQIRALSDLCIQAYQQLLSITEARLQSVIVPALLESESLAGSAGKLPLSRKGASSDSRVVGGEAPSMDSLLRELRALYTAMSRQALPPELMEQAFHQLTYLMCASAFNSLLLRKDMCSWSRGMQIRYNVSLLEEWLRSRELSAGGAVATLEPLIQAVQLLQMGKKTEGDAKSMVQTCTALSSQQIVKILTLYTPHSDLDERVTLNFIRTVQGLLKNRSDSQAPQILMDVRQVFPVTFPCLPSPNLHADQLKIPDNLKISFLRRA